MKEHPTNTQPANWPPDKPTAAPPPSQRRIGPSVHCTEDGQSLVCTGCVHQEVEHDGKHWIYWCKHPAQAGKSTGDQWCGFTPETPDFCPEK